MVCRVAALLLALLVLTAPARAQSTAGCEIGVAEAQLDAAAVRATLYNLGGLFWRGQGSQYEVPKGLGRVPLFNASLMVGGLVEGEVRFAGSTYGPWEYWPGPLAADGTTTAATCAAYDRIWVVRTADLEAYAATGTATADLAEWPVGVGAPFYTDADGNGRQDPAEPTVSLDPGDPGYGTRTLDLGAGERPVVFGRQTAWWVMNDAGGPHEWSGRAGPAYREPLGIEVRATAWVSADEATRELSESTFYRFEVINRSPRPIWTAHAGLYLDGDLGNFNDDRVGTDSTRQMVVFHNGDEVDEGGGGYGDRPPALGITALNGAWAGTTPFKNGPGYGEASDAVEGYNYLRGLWRDGTPITVGGIGYDPSVDDRGGSPGAFAEGDVVRWAFPGDVVLREYWSQENIDGDGEALTPSDKYAILSGLPADLDPGERMVFDVGILFATGLSRLDSVTELREVADLAQSLYNVGALTTPQADPPPPPAPEPLGPVAPFVEGGSVTLEWTAVPEAEWYVVELFADADGTEPLPRLADREALRTTRDPSLTLWSSWFPINQREPFSWRVRAVRLGASSPTTALSPFSFFIPGFDRFSVLANASGPLTPPLVEDSGSFGSADALARQQTDGAVWRVWAVQPRVGRTPEAGVGAPFPSDYEVRFVRSRRPDHVALADSSGQRVAVPFELWDIGVGTPDDPRDDVRLIPVLVGGGEPVRFEARPGPPDYTTYTARVRGYAPPDRAPGQRGFQAWIDREDRALPDSSLLVLPGVSFDRTAVDSSEPRPTVPEPGTVFRFSSSALALPVAQPEGPSTLALDARPNPARSRATVGYRLAVDADVRLRVVDVLGREVAVLAEGPRTAGAHTAALDASRLAAGVYVLELRAGDARAVRTITVAR